MVLLSFEKFSYELSLADIHIFGNISMTSSANYHFNFTHIHAINYVSSSKFIIVLNLNNKSKA